MGNEGSSSSDSGSVGACSGTDCGVGCGARDGTESLMDVGTGFRAGAVCSSSVESAEEGAGVSSSAECFPVVHGAMARNSSNVRTRGLQHFQPTSIVLVKPRCDGDNRNGRADTFLPFVEDGRSGMVGARLFRISELFAATFMNTFLRHHGKSLVAGLEAVYWTKSVGSIPSTQRIRIPMWKAVSLRAAETRRSFHSASLFHRQSSRVTP